MGDSVGNHSNLLWQMSTGDYLQGVALTGSTGQKVIFLSQTSIIMNNFLLYLVIFKMIIFVLYLYCHSQLVLYLKVLILDFKFMKGFADV